jgi:hypothetical protein
MIDASKNNDEQISLDLIKDPKIYEKYEKYNPKT